MPNSDHHFREFLETLIEFSLLLSALERAKASRKYIRTQVYVYTAQVEAAGYYKQAAHIQAAKNAVFAGIVALCTMYVGGLIMGAVGRMTAAGQTATTTGRTLLAIRGFTVLEYTGGGARMAGLTFLETTALEGAIGVPLRGALGALGSLITGAYTGRLNWGDVAKVGLLATGGVFRVGPALGFLFGGLSSREHARLRQRFEAEITRAAVKKLIENHLDVYAKELELRVKNNGRYAPLLLVPPAELDEKIRQPVSREANRITDEIVKEETGFFGGPKRGDVYAGVYGKFGAEVWAPIAQQTSRAFIDLEMGARAAKKKLDKAFLRWANSVK